MDMVGRKLMDGGKAAYALIDEIAETLEGDVVSAALTQATDWMVKAEMNDRFAGATSYLRAFALGLGAHYLEKAASVDPARKPLSDFYAAHFTPQVAALCVTAMAGSGDLYAISPEQMSA